MTEGMPDENDAEELLNFLDELFLVNSDPDVDLDGDDDTIGADWDEMGDFELDGDEDGEDEEE
jgi:hypothetical protein